MAMSPMTVGSSSSCPTYLFAFSSKVEISFSSSFRLLSLTGSPSCSAEMPDEICSEG
uniref:Uncharacterized protein n=1 Tax=Anguilla anguilla TaxID=7936 RepID=A0A0E9TFG4_ANGAN